MAINFNGINPSQIIFNGTSLSQVIFNGVVVWTAFTSKTFTYTGGVQEFTVPCDGIYILEVYGAKGCGSGGYGDGVGGGYGGYARGEVYLSGGSKIYIVVGQSPTGATGGYNGGGNGNIGGGGGCTHIGTFNSTLASHGSTSGLYIVAGGGGGVGAYGSGEISGGFGGGASGEGGIEAYDCDSGDFTAPGGGTQTAGGKGGHYEDPETEGWWDDDSFDAGAGSFGQGGAASGGTGGGGGGGLYGGGGSAAHNGVWISGGGGSGYTGGCSANTLMLTGVNSAPKAIITLKQNDLDFTSANNFYVVQNGALTSYAVNPAGGYISGSSYVTATPGLNYSGNTFEQYSGEIYVSVDFNNPNNLKFVTVNYGSYNGHQYTDSPLNNLSIIGYKSDGSSVTLFNKGIRKIVDSQSISQEIKGYTKVKVKFQVGFDGHSCGINADFKNIYVHN